MVGCICDLTEGIPGLNFPGPLLLQVGVILTSQRLTGLLSSRRRCSPWEGGGQGKEENTTRGLAHRGQVLCQQHPQQPCRDPKPAGGRGGGSEGRSLMTLRPGPQGTVPHSNVSSPAPVSSLSPWPAQCLLAMPGTAISQAIYAWAPFPPLDSGPGPWLLSSSKKPQTGLSFLLVLLKWSCFSWASDCWVQPSVWPASGSGLPSPWPASFPMSRWQLTKLQEGPVAMLG